MNILRGWIFLRGEYFSGVNIFQEWIFSMIEYFSGVNIFHLSTHSPNIWVSHNLLGLVLSMFEFHLGQLVGAVDAIRIRVEISFQQWISGEKCESSISLFLRRIFVNSLRKSLGGNNKNNLHSGNITGIRSCSRASTEGLSRVSFIHMLDWSIKSPVMKNNKSWWVLGYMPHLKMG